MHLITENIFVKNNLLPDEWPRESRLYIITTQVFTPHPIFSILTIVKHPLVR